MTGRAWLLTLLAVAVFASAVTRVLVKHETRGLFAELQALKREKDRLQVEWGQLQLEESTWATHSRVEAVAREKLGMVLPSAESIVVLEP